MSDNEWKPIATAREKKRKNLIAAFDKLIADNEAYYQVWRDYVRSPPPAAGGE